MTIDQFQSLAQTIVAWLAPFFPYLIKGAKLAGKKWFEGLGEEGGEQAVKKATKLWDTIKKKSSDEMTVEGASMILSEHPKNKAAQEMLAAALVELIQKHPELYQTLQDFKQNMPNINIDQRSGGVYFSEKSTIKGDVVGHDQKKTGK